MLTLLAVIVGAESAVDVETLGLHQPAWLPGVPEAAEWGTFSRDLISQVFARLDPTQLGPCFLSWVSSIFQISDEPDVVAGDGKWLSP